MKLSTRCAYLLLFVFVCVAQARGVSAPFRWGHDGFNGAAFSHAARNSLRHDFVPQVQYYFGREWPPPDSQIYMHHPPMLHFHLIAAFALGGEEVWLGRAISAGYTILTWLLLVLLLRRYASDRLAIVSGAVYALAPIFLIFGNFINHEPGGMFWCLMTIGAYLYFLEHRRLWLGTLTMILCASISQQFDWSGYYIAFAVASVHFLRMVNDPEMRKTWPLWVVFCFFSLANFVGFFAWVRFTLGDLSDMESSFSVRSGSPDGYWGRLVERNLVLYGALPLAGFLLSVFTLSIRALRRRLQPVDTIAFAFCFAGGIQITVFKQAGWVHSYWGYYFLPAIAVGTARVLLLLGAAAEKTSAWFERSIRERVQGGPNRRLPVSQTLGGLCIAAPLLLHAPFALETWLEQVRLGHGSFANPPDQDAELSFVLGVASEFDPRETSYVIHRSLQGLRIEAFYYLDAPHHPSYGIHEQVPGDDDVRVLLVDLAHISVAERARLDRLMPRHRTTIWDDRFVSIAFGEVEQEQLSRFSLPPRQSLAHRWTRGFPYVALSEWSDPLPSSEERGASAVDGEAERPGESGAAQNEATAGEVQNAATAGEVNVEEEVQNTEDANGEASGRVL